MFRNVIFHKSNETVDTLYQMMLIWDQLRQATDNFIIPIHTSFHFKIFLAIRA